MNSSLSGAANAYIQFITVLIIFVLVLVVTYFTTKWIASYQKGKTAEGNIEVIETYRLSSTKYLQIVRTGSKYIVIAVCKDTVTTLTQLKKEEIQFDASEGDKGISFKTLLDKAKEHSNLEKGNETNDK